MKMKIQPVMIFGALLILLGIAGLIHPRIMLPKQRDTTVATPGTIVTTQRIITVPWYLSGLLILAGAAYIFSATPKGTPRPPRRQ
jgi:hypothetical protein